MEGLAFSMGPNGDGSVSEQQHEGSSNTSTVIDSPPCLLAPPASTGGHGEGAEGRAKARKKRKGAEETAGTSEKRRERSATWSKDTTDELLGAYTQVSEDKGRFRKSSVCDQSFWEAVSQKVQGRTWKECQRRMDTLTKSWRAIQKYCDINQKELTQLTEEILRSMKLATAMTVDWYNQMCEIKKKSDNAKVASTVDRKAGQSKPTSAVFAPGLVCFLFTAEVFKLMLPILLLRIPSMKLYKSVPVRKAYILDIISFGI
ncbi:hypothetical protein M758_2G185000 [Ceratodon purpureus]|nr:hypothetical protein M758_2G185000 [Ceratodon purpureus]